MPEQAVGTQAGAGTAGTGATPPAAAPQGSSTGAAPPGPQAGQPGAAGGGSTAGSPAGGTVDQVRRELELRLTNQGRELADLKRQMAERAAGTERPPQGVPPQAPPPSPGGVGERVGEPTPYAKSLYQWATQQYNGFAHPHTYQEPDTVNPETGETVRGRLVTTEADDRAAMEHARIQEGVLRPLGFTEFPWTGKYDFSRAGGVQAPQPGVPMTQEQLDAWFESKRQQAAISDLDVDEQFDESLKAVCESRKLGPDFFAARVDMGNGRQQTRERAIGRFLARERLQPTQENLERAILTLYPSDLWAYNQQFAYNGGLSQRRDDQQGRGVPGVSRNVPFPETPADAQALAAYDSVSAGPNQHFSGKPANAGRVVDVDGVRRM